MAIYGRCLNKLTITRHAVLADVQRLTKRRPDKQDREAIKNGSYVVVKEADGKEDLYHLAFLRADNGLVEISETIEGTVPAGLEIIEDEQSWPKYITAQLGLDPTAKLEIATLSAALRARGYRVLRAEQLDGKISAHVAPLGGDAA